MQIVGYLALIRFPPLFLPCRTPSPPVLDQSSLSRVTSRNFLQEKMDLHRQQKFYSVNKCIIIILFLSSCCHASGHDRHTWYDPHQVVLPPFYPYSPVRSFHIKTQSQFTITGIIHMEQVLNSEKFASSENHDLRDS